jgi:hypothetical protein
MARRQPYQTTVPTGAPSGPVKDDALEIEGGGLQVTLDDADLVTPAESQDPGLESAPIPEEPPLREPPREQPRSADDEAYTRLKNQLERAERDRLEMQNRSERERSALEGNLRDERERGEQLRRDHLVTQELAIDNAMRVAEREAAAAEDAIQRALEAADYAAAAKAQRILSQADNDLARLREGKLAVETEKSRSAQQTQGTRQERASEPSTMPAREPQSDWERVEVYITQPAHPPRVQEYMRRHYDDLFADGGARVNKLVAAHYEAKAQGLPEFSDQYFKAVDKHMGYAKSEDAPASQQPPQRTSQAQEPPRQRAAIPPAAPVSRGAPTNQTSGTSITLTPAQVQFCRESGIDPKVYARQMLAINRGSSDTNYTGPRWTRDMGA